MAEASEIYRGHEAKWRPGWEPTMTAEEIAATAERMKSLNWVHRINLGNGLITPGLWVSNPSLTLAVDAIDFKGKKVLDVGCWDGLFSFEAERRGAAEVYATDLNSQRDFASENTFQFASRVLKSKAHYEPNLSVYNVEQLGVRNFDIVIFAGVYYHLKDPIRALTALRRVMKPGGTIIVEGAILEDEGCFAKFYYRKQFCGDSSNWWVPTKQCLREWIECSYFRIKREYAQWGHLENQRHTVLAYADLRNDVFHSRLDDELKEYDTRQR